MGASGSAWIKSKASSARGLRGGDRYGAPAHPVAVKSGQRYWPRRRSGTTSKVTIAVTRVDRRTGAVVGRREDVDRRTVALRAERLLAARADGQGEHYQFLGWLDRSYATVLHVLDPGERMTWVCLPEWHVNRAFEFFSHLVPDDCRYEGALVRCRARLASPTAGALNLADLRAATPADCEGVPLPGHPEVGPRSQPAASEACGDLVVTLPSPLWEALFAGEMGRGLYLTGPTPPAPAGGTLYLSDGDEITHACPLHGIRPNPNGFVLEIDTGELTALDARVTFRERTEWPPQNWQWRWWDA